MDNTKTAEEKPLQEQVISALGLRLDDEGKETLRKIVYIVDQCEAPLKKRIEELETLLDGIKHSNLNTVKNITNALLEPSTYGNHD